MPHIPLVCKIDAHCFDEPCSRKQNIKGTDSLVCKQTEPVKLQVFVSRFEALKLLVLARRSNALTIDEDTCHWSFASFALAQTKLFRSQNTSSSPALTNPSTEWMRYCHDGHECLLASPSSAIHD